MQTLRWWLRIVGVFYVLQFVLNAIVHAPISTVGPKDALALASAGDPLARFLVDTWVTFGLEIGAIGVALVVASRRPEQAKVLVWTIIAIELARGIANDIYMIARGYDLTVFINLDCYPHRGHPDRASCVGADWIRRQGQRSERGVTANCHRVGQLRDKLIVVRLWSVGRRRFFRASHQVDFGDGPDRLRDIPLRDSQRLGHKMPAFSDGTASQRT